MKEIGGYFSFELPNYTNFPHPEGILLNSGRNALEYILRTIQDLQKIYIPYFTCDVVLEPLKKLNVPYEFYRIDENLEIHDDFTLLPGEYILLTNYFGIKDQYIKQTSMKCGASLIVDNAQALYAHPLQESPTFYSPRKFCGLPDGGVVYVKRELDEQLQSDISYDRCSHLLRRIDSGASAGYSDFKENSRKLSGMDIMKMSDLTRVMVNSIDFDAVKSARRSNFDLLREALDQTNLLKIPSSDSFECPMVYPYWSADPDLKGRLIASKVFVATYWPNVKGWCEQGQLESLLAQNIVPIPIDQRYDSEDMKAILKIILS